MSIVSTNIRHFRKKLGLTQEQLAEKIGIKRSVIGAYEEGRADPKLNTLMRFADEFGVSVDHLISLDFSTDPEISEKTNPGPKMQVLAITVDNSGDENIELVPQKAAAGYMNGYADPEYLSDLPKFRLPTLNGSGTYRAFEISGDSMLPLEAGTIVVGKYVESWKDVKNGRTYIILSKQEGVVYKRVFNYADEKGVLYLVSDNPVYSPYEVKLEDLHEIWEAKAFISTKFPEPGAQQDISLEKLSGIVMSLQQEITKLRSGR